MVININALSSQPGSIAPFGGTVVPSGWLECDGTAVSRATFSALFTAIGTTWGVGDGSTTFNLPDLTRRTPVGRGGAGTGTLGNTVGNTGGSETHTLTTAELASHSHAGGSHSHNTHNDGAGNNIYLDNSTFNGGTGAGSGGFNGIIYRTNSLSGGTASQTSTDSAGGTGGAGSDTPHNIVQPSAIVMMIIKT